MFDTIFANELFHALHLLEQFETKSAQGAMAVPFFAINKIYALLDKATDKGDCVAPYFLHYMHDAGYNSASSRVLPDLTLVPSHRAQGEKWVKCYKIYLETLNLHNALPQGTQLIFAFTVTEGRLKLKASSMRCTKIKEQIQEKIMELANLEHPLGYLFCAKLIEKFNHHVDVIDTLYRQSAFYPNVWGMQAYWKFLQTNHRYNPVLEEHVKLKKELELLEQYEGNWESLIEYHQSQQNVRWAQQWIIHASLHGETKDPSHLIVAYVRGTTQWMTPISSPEALREAIKWLNWLVSKYSDAPHFPAILQRRLNDFLADINVNNYETNIITLKIIDYIFQNFSTLTDSSIYPTSALTVQAILWMDNATKEVCHRIYNTHSRDPILVGNYQFSTALALDFETQNNHRLAENWHRNSLRLMPDEAIAQYNMANILHKQKKGQQESIELWLKAALNGCRDSFESLLSFIFIHNCLSSKQINQCIQLAQTFLFNIENIQFDETEQPRTLPLIPWLYEAFDYKVYKEQFKVWKFLAQQDVTAATAKKEQLLHETLEQHAIQEAVATLLPKLDPSHTDVETDIDDDQAPKENEVDMTMQRALDTLEALGRKRMRNLTMRDRINVQKCFQIIIKGSSIELSTKGRTSGSRMQLDDETLHLPHGRDRMSPGAQHKIKRRIEEVAQQYTAPRPLTM